MLLLAIGLVALLISAGVMPNPFPGIWEWVNRERPLAAGLAWQERLGSRPGSATAAGDAIAVAAGSRAQLRERDSGDLIVPAEGEEWSAGWVVIAGSGSDTRVISSEGGESGYQVRDPDTGRVIHEDDQAVAVWGFSDAWLDLRCDDNRACQLRAYQPGRMEPIWRTDLPGERDGMLGGNPELPSPRGGGADRIAEGVSGPAPIPPVLGFPVSLRDAEVVLVVDTRTGQIRQQAEQSGGERVLVVGNRLIRSTMTRHNGICVSEVAGHDAGTGDPVWGPESYHVWGTGDVGCEQRVAPLAGGSAMSAVAPDGRPLVLDAYDGRVLWSGTLDEQVETLSPDQAVIRAEDGTTRYAVPLGRDGGRSWERRADQDAELAIAECGIVVADRHPDRVYVWDPDTGEDLLSLSTSARVLACAPDGVLIAEGRSVGFARFDGGDGGEPAGDGDDRDPPLDVK